MALAAFKKLAVYGYGPLKRDFLEAVQKLGAIEMAEPAAARTDNTGGGAEMARSCLDSYRQFIRKGLLESFIPGKFSAEPGEIASALRDFPLEDFHRQCKARDSRLGEMEAGVKKLSADYSALSEWFGLNLKISELRGTKTVGLHTFRLQGKRLPQLRQETEEFCFIEEIRKARNYSLCVAAFSREEKNRLEEALSLAEAEMIDISLDGQKPDITVEEAGEQIKNRISRCRSEIAALREEKKKGSENIRSLMILHDCFMNAGKRRAAEETLSSTGSVFFFSGWIPEKQLGRLKKLVDSDFPEVHFEAAAPSPGDEPPVLLENAAPAEPFESVTGLYGMPGRRELDPTPFFAPFFAVFFAICMTDAGYGAVLLALSLLLMKKAKPGPGAMKFMKLIALTGIATIAAGVLTGGYFGIQPGDVPPGFAPFLEFREKTMLFDPMEQFLLFMLISLGLGFLQVWFGYFVRMLQGIKAGSGAAAAGSQLPWLLILPGFLLLGIVRSPETVLLGLAEESPLGDFCGSAGKVMVYTGIAGMFIRAGGGGSPLKKLGLGAYSLYGIIGCLGDILSYVRLFALGLATVAMAIAVNTMAGMAAGIPVAGFLIASLIAAAGHIGNAAINALSAFIHTVRLQFVEFFTRFYEGGGREFRPFRYETEFVEEHSIRDCL